MQYLLDTHTFIWFINGDDQLSTNAKRQILDFPNSTCFVSIASLWEIAIKINLRKLTFKKTLKEVYLEISTNRFELLPLTFKHTLHVSTLPLKHRDPFDRILIAQAMEENLTIISRDKNFQLYKNIHLLW